MASIASFISSLVDQTNGVRLVDEVKKTNIALTGIKIFEANVQFSSQLLQSQREDGVTVTDSRNIQPSSVFMQAFCTTKDAVGKIDKLFKDLENRKVLFTLTIGSIQLHHMVLSSYQIIHNSQAISATPVTIKFKQILLADNNAPAYKAAGDFPNVKSILNSALNKAETTITDFVKSLF